MKSIVILFDFKFLYYHTIKFWQFSSYSLKTIMIKFDFHISRKAREEYNFEDSFYSNTGNLIIATPQRARIISDRINAKRKSLGEYGNLVSAGEVNALGLLHEILHFLIRNYEQNMNPGVFSRGLNYLKTSLSEYKLEEVLLTYINEFPPLSVFKGKQTADEYLTGTSGGKPNREVILEEIIILHLENTNPAASHLNELFDDRVLKEKTKYEVLIKKTEEFFEKETPTGYGGLHLFKMLKKPIQANPYNLEMQLNFILKEFGVFIDSSFIKRLLRGKDLIKEDYKLFVKHGTGEKATPPVPDYKAELERLRLLKLQAEKDVDISLTEAERFTEDTYWMPEVVMIAKNIFVWLHQLSEKYNRPINKLDEIPDEELNTLASWNFTALWLIGIWERSSASEKIKKMTGNPEAASSAYSLYDYEIAHELGGNEAFMNLKHRARLRGINLASDMVPNHTGIYSKWVVEKPDYFIQRNQPPYPSYTFNGPNLSEDERVEIRIEDKYYSREDAAVVFERKDSYTGDKRYIYHGNDGTNMPWNDTAQLNLLNPETREALIQTIMHVARMTPIIRFDAAMTLTQKHYQRLWFPEPGEGGAIPSRSDYSMTKKEFLKLMPVEFWREVVDRINEEMPNTLLLAEAFWLMEGYFVRTLGMHRVYNSAFMHMLMKEENDKYRKLIINTLQFNPEILKRYVNFMSNPDEETAINQFGKDDKYFGVAAMMVTISGLPMFGHGQIEGFTEKYGMEYKRAYYDEHVDEHLVWRHQKEIFPLLKKRYLFSQVENFEFYDFIDENGNVNENVFAYSNKSNDEKVFVIYNNSYSTVTGTIKHTVPKVQSNNNSSLQYEKSIAEILDIKNDKHYFYVYDEHRNGLQFLISGTEINKKGFEHKLYGYQYKICFNLKEIYDDTGKYKILHKHLNGRGVASVEEALLEMDLIHVHSAMEELLSPPEIRSVRDFLLRPESTPSRKLKKKVRLSPSVKNRYKTLLTEIKNHNKIEINVESAEKKFEKYLLNTKGLYDLWLRYNNRKSVPKWILETNDFIPINAKSESIENVCTYYTFTVINSFIKNGNKNLFDKLWLKKPLQVICEQHGSDGENDAQLYLIKSLLNFNGALKSIKIKIGRKRETSSNKKLTGKRALLQKLDIAELLNDNDVRSYLKVNEFEGTTYFNKENFEKLIRWFLQLSIIKAYFNFDKTLSNISKRKNGKSNKKPTKQELEREYLSFVKNNFHSAKNLIWLASEAGYDLKRFTNSLIQVNGKKKLKKKKEIKNET